MDNSLPSLEETATTDTATATSSTMNLPGTSPTFLTSHHRQRSSPSSTSRVMVRRRQSTGGVILRRPPAGLTRQNSKGEGGNEGPSALKHLVDYSRKKATYNNLGAENRSNCRGPVMTKRASHRENSTTTAAANNNNKPRRGSMGAESLDWNLLNTTMDLSNEDHHRNNNNPTMNNSNNNSEHSTNSRNCTARLRVNLAKSASVNWKPSSEHSTGTTDTGSGTTTRMDLSCPEQSTPHLSGSSHHHEEGVIWIEHNNNSEEGEETVEEVVDADAPTPRRRIGRSRSLDNSSMKFALLRYRRKPVVPQNEKVED